MVDIETLATSVDAHILSIGFVVFDPLEWTSLEKLVAPPGFRLVLSSENQGRYVDPATVRWWFEQTPEAREHLLNTEFRLSLPSALEELRRVYKSEHCEAIWSHGSNFDLSILDDAYHHTLHGRSPWHYREVRDTRTLFSVLPPSQWPENPCKHDPLWDAACQAQAVQGCYSELEGLRDPRWEHAL